MNKFWNRLCIVGGVIAVAGCQALAPTQQAAAPTLKQMPVEGTSLAYIDQGRGTPVVFVHGAMSDHRTWGYQREAIAKAHRYIAMDQRYFGPAAWPDKGEKLGLETQINDLAAFVRGLNVGPVFLVGWSMSGASTLGVAIRHPHLVRGVFVYEPATNIALPDPELAKAAAQDRGAMFGRAMTPLKAGDTAAAVKALFEGIDDQPGNFDSLPKAEQAVVLENARTLPPAFSNPPAVSITCEQLGQIRKPVTIVRGELTRPFFRIVADNAVHCIPGARLLVAPGQRHRGPVTDPVGFNEALRSFIAANS